MILYNIWFLYLFIVYSLIMEFVHNLRSLELRKRLRNILGVYFRHSALEIVVNEILHRHNEPWRAFHTMEHIISILDMMDDNPVLVGNNEKYNKLAMVALYHDIVYKPWRKDNEEKSAEYFQTHWRKYYKKFPEQYVVENFIHKCILQTKKHDGKKHLEHIFNSMDMSIISGTKQELLDWENKISFEYSFVSYPMYKKRRINFLFDYKQHGNIEYLMNYVRDSNKSNSPILYFIKNKYINFLHNVEKFFLIDL